MDLKVGKRKGALVTSKSNPILSLCLKEAPAAKKLQKSVSKYTFEQHFQVLMLVLVVTDGRNYFVVFMFISVVAPT